MTGLLPWLIAMVLAVAVLPVAGQEAPAGPAGREPEIEAAHVDSSHALEAFQSVERWVASGHDPEPSQRPIRVMGVSGVRVTLRWQGVAMGRGDVAVAAGIAATDLGALCADATRIALRETRESIDRLASRAQAAAPATPHEPLKFESVVKRLRVDLQVALPMEPIRLQQGDKPAAILALFVPGYHGLHFRRPGAGGAVMEHWIWPASAIASNTSPGSQVVQSLSRLRYDITDPERARAALTGPDAPTIERFTVIHLVRRDEALPAMQLVRGNAALPPTSLDEKAVAELSRRIAAHLTRRVLDDGRVLAEFAPASDEWGSREPDDAAAALAALSLARWGRVAKGDATGGPASAAAVRAVRRFADHAGQPSPAASSLLLLAIAELPDPGAFQEYRDKIVKYLIDHHTHEGVLAVNVPDPRSPAATQPAPAQLTTPEMALIFAGLSKVYEQTRDGALGVKVSLMQSLLWSRMRDADLVGIMPWIAEAGRVAIPQVPMAPMPAPAAGTAAAAATSDRDIHATFARLVRELRARQITAPPAVGPADVVGAFELRAVPMDAAPAPDWHSAQVLAFMAVVLRDPQALPAEDRVPTLLACGMAARYLDQLTFNADACFFVRSPDDVIGGVRLSLWDNRLPLSPSAMSLLALSELRATLEELAKRN
ncbi:MAG: hypothetical protein K8S99_12555 [Planctomycetes bacterium]|nr:hypothetical protein [Planctomycetota bacterium]